MHRRPPRITDDPDLPFDGAGAAEADLWFLPGPMEEDAFPVAPAGPAGSVGGAVGGLDADGAATVAAWAQAEAGLAARMARVAAGFGALDDRLRRGPAGWRHRLALIEAAELSWLAGDRIAPDRLALWLALRLSGAQADPTALARAAWAVRRLTGGPGPGLGPEAGPEVGPEPGPVLGPEAGPGLDSGTGLAPFLGRHAPGAPGGGAPADRLADRTGAWEALMRAAAGLHPISRAALGYHLWHLTGPDADPGSGLVSGLGSGLVSGPSPRGDMVEAAVTAARLAAAEATGTVFAPLAMGGAEGLRMGGGPAGRLAAWLGGMEAGVRHAMRHLDGIEAWTARAEAAMARRSGRTPGALRTVLAEWPLVSAPMAERLTGASRAAVQRNLAWMEARGLIREVTRQGRFRMWRAAT